MRSWLALTWLVSSCAEHAAPSRATVEPPTGLLFMQVLNEAGNAVIAHRPFVAIDRHTPTIRFPGTTDEVGLARVEGVPPGDYVLCLEDVEDMAIMVVLRPGDHAQSQLLAGDFRDPTGGTCAETGEVSEACLARREARRPRPSPCSVRRPPLP